MMRIITWSLSRIRSNKEERSRFFLFSKKKKKRGFEICEKDEKKEKKRN